MTFFTNVTTLLFCSFSITVTKVISHCKDNGIMLLLSKRLPKHFARCSEHYEEEKEKEIVLNFVIFISVTLINS